VPGSGSSSSARARMRPGRGFPPSADRDEQALAPRGAEFTAFSGALVAALRDGFPTAPPQLTLAALHEHLTRTLTGAGKPAPVLQTGNGVRRLVLAPNAADRSTPGVASDPTGAVPNGDTGGDTECPYRGLESYTAADSALFHGRGELVERVLDHIGDQVREGGLTIVAGPSGSGKSSLLHAGVGPAIAHGDLAVAGSAAWPQVMLTPGTDPAAALAQRIAELHPGTTVAAARAALAEGRGRALVAAVTRAAPPAAATGGRLVIVVDQVEEAFDPETPDADRAAFLALLEELTHRDGDDDPVAVVVLGLRSDFTGECVRGTGRGPGRAHPRHDDEQCDTALDLWDITDPDQPVRGGRVSLNAGGSPLAFRGDGELIYVDSSTLRVADARFDQLSRRVCAAAGAELSADQWRRFVGDAPARFLAVRCLTPSTDQLVRCAVRGNRRPHACSARPPGGQARLRRRATCPPRPAGAPVRRRRAASSRTARRRSGAGPWCRS
jgi:energy-coupling factor transporter ATP-binding protein EcfA2